MLANCLEGLQGLHSKLNEWQRTPDTLAARPSSTEIDHPGKLYTSPDDCPRKKRCDTCGKDSGNPNKLQLDWIHKKCSEMKKQSVDRNMPMFIVPEQPNLRKVPKIVEYVLRPFLLWWPDRQFHFPLSWVSCPFCEGESTLKFKEFSRVRPVHSMESDLYFVSAVYVCAGPTGCHKSFHGHEKHAQDVFPCGVFGQLPVRVFKRSCWTTELLSWVIDSLGCGMSAGSIASVIAKSRTSYYLRKAMLFDAHIKRYKQASGLPDTPFDKFPKFDHHCTFNSTLGPSSKTIHDVAMESIECIKPLLLRWINGGHPVAFDFYEPCCL